jgi:SAM-dependent methyltransferase
MGFEALSGRSVRILIARYKDAMLKPAHSNSDGVIAMRLAKDFRRLLGAAKRRLVKNNAPVIASWQGECPICQNKTTFEARHEWFRDNLICRRCDGGSIPRQRALMQVLHELAPNWRELRIHESSPGNGGASRVLSRDCKSYLGTQYFPDVVPGNCKNGARCENLEAQTFPDESFDVVITQDVMEHVFHPDRVYREVYRTLRPGGLYIHTVPIYNDRVTSERRASLAPDGSIVHHAEPEYHGNPIDPLGSLVTFHYGYDLHDLVAEWTPFDVEVRRFHQRTAGIVGEFGEVVICRKPCI